MGRGVWRATVRRVSQSWTRLKGLSTHTRWFHALVPCGSDGQESASNAGDLGSVPGLGRSPGERNGNLLQYSCLGNPMDRGTWWATAVHGVSKKGTGLSDFHSCPVYLGDGYYGVLLAGQCNADNTAESLNNAYKGHSVTKHTFLDNV